MRTPPVLAEISGRGVSFRGTAKHTTPESWRGSPKINFSTRQWFSKVETAFKGDFEGICPPHHSGVVWPSWWVRPCESPHGGVRPFHQKSICLTELSSGPYAVRFDHGTPHDLGSTKASYSTECSNAKLAHPTGTPYPLHPEPPSAWSELPRGPRTPQPPHPH